MSKPQQVLELDPPSELIFVGLSESEFIERRNIIGTSALSYYPFVLRRETHLRLSNPTPQAVFFKVESNVYPNSGLIEPGDSEYIEIIPEELSRNGCVISDSGGDVTRVLKILTAYQTDESTSPSDFWNTVDKSQIMESTLTVKLLRWKLSPAKLQVFISKMAIKSESAQKTILNSQVLVDVIQKKEEEHSKNGDIETANSLANEIEVLQDLVLVFETNEIEFRRCNEHFEKGDLPLFEKEAEQASKKFQEDITQFQIRLKSLLDKLTLRGIIGKHNEETQNRIIQSQKLVEMLREKQEKYSKSGDMETANSLANEIEVLQGLALAFKQKDIWLRKCGDHVEKENLQLFKKDAEQLQQRQKSLAEKLETLSIIEKITEKQMLLRNVDKDLGEEILNTIIIPSNPFTVGRRQGTGVKLADIEGNDKAKEAIQQSVIYPMINPRLFSGLRAASKGILLYGPPGNGKTMIAKAAAEEAKCIFFNISSSAIMPKCYSWAGGKMVKTLFQMARNAQPSIIFIDEIDSMLCERSANEHGGERQVKTEFLAQMEGCASQSDEKFLVLGATNRPQELDDGVLRRLPQRIFIDLPNAAARRSFIVSTFQKHKTAYEMTNSELDEIANMTEGYSYSDLRDVCKEAAREPLKEIDTSELSETTPDMLRPMNYQDLITAIQSVNPSTNMENRRKLQEFASGGDRKGLK
ncbi:ATPase family associated with various cellular activities (AAA) domain-containing protein [Ditylenchus destructor]|nr:ATPase family associated with various cellular activities (AAA) domain-containing protein [Ditylenchus destructor]